MPSPSEKVKALVELAKEREDLPYITLKIGPHAIQDLATEVEKLVKALKVISENAPTNQDTALFRRETARAALERWQGKGR